jgi:hypothetical protein
VPVRLLIAAFLLGHAAVHAAFVSPRPPVTATGPAWPFNLDRSWILSPAGVDTAFSRPLGMALVAITIGAFALAAVATLGVLPGSVWVLSVVLGSIASLGLLVLFFEPWLVLGIGIDVALLWTALGQTWTPAALG